MIAVHQTLEYFHLLGDFRIGGHAQAAVGGFSQINGVALTRFEMGERLLGQNETDRIADLAKF